MVGAIADLFSCLGKLEEMHIAHCDLKRELVGRVVGCWSGGRLSRAQLHWTGHAAAAH